MKLELNWNTFKKGFFNFNRYYNSNCFHPESIFGSKKDLDDIHEKVKKKKYKILMELNKTFWGAWFMMFEDSNGIAWLLGYGENMSTTHP